MRTRREFLLQSTSGAIALGFLGFLGPAGLACSRGKPSGDLQVLSEEQAATYDAWCDVLAVGASGAGVARYLDQYLAAPFPETFLFLRLLENAPLDAFYVNGIAGIEDESKARFGKRFLALTDGQRRSVVDAAATSSTVAWTDPAPSFFYFISRADAVDVVYGTERGFLELGVPYLPHIRPPKPW
jgi:hypothetical protein